jgi:DNA-binding CsgD family transcriptional regulator
LFLRLGDRADRILKELRLIRLSKCSVSLAIFASGPVVSESAMKQDDLFTLLENLSQTTKLQETTDNLKQSLVDLGLDHISYFAANIPTQKSTMPLLAVTYAPEWQRHYYQNNYVDIDPVVRAGLGGILPIDWADVDRSQRVVQRFFSEAQDFDIGHQGLSFPIRGRMNEFALFSVTSNVTDKEWQDIRQRLMPQLMLIAHHFHHYALLHAGVEPPNYAQRLSQREKECLRWRASGKSDWDIAHIMNISERTVKFHLENARAKLDAINTTHAVAKALATGTIALF